MTGHRKIGVLLGGLSAERDVSIRSGEAILTALAERGHDAVPIFVDRDLDLVLRQTRIDVAFLALHGRYGEDGCVQGLLEILGIPYTGSGVLASGLAMNKGKAKEMFRLHNLPTAPGYVIQADSGEDVIESHGSFGFPSSSSRPARARSLGIKIARDELELETAVEEALRFDDDVLVERFIDGKEISVGVLDGKALGAVEVAPKRGFYDFHEQVHGGPRPTTTCRRACRPSATARRCGSRRCAHDALGCDGATRVDLIVSERGNEFVLEVNTLPGMTPTSLLPRIARGAGPLVRGPRRGDPAGRAPARPRPPPRPPRRPDRAARAPSAAWASSRTLTKSLVDSEAIASARGTLQPDGASRAQTDTGQAAAPPIRRTPSCSSTASCRGSSSTPRARRGARRLGAAARAPEVPRDRRLEPRRVLHGPRRGPEAAAHRRGRRDAPPTG